MSLFSLAAVPLAVAQSANSFPTVTLYATDPLASEAGLDTGTFTVKRIGPTNLPLIVFYHLSGTASNGVDYEQLGGSVQIPAGAPAASFVVKPIDDLLAEGDETVVAQITGSPLACATCGYDIGVPSNAVVVIRDDDVSSNQPPFVRINQPQDGSVFFGPVDIQLNAFARDAEDGYNLKVEFFEGAKSLGFGTFVPALCPDPYCPFYALTWSNAPPGRYELTARATDHNGAMSVSSPVLIDVIATNLVAQPVVNIFATDDTGSEIPEVPPWLEIAQRIDPAVFTVTRTGPTNLPLTVFYSVGGTASNGMDYVALPGNVTIPVGADSANIEVWVIDDFLVEGTETVELTLHPPACLLIFPPPPDCYLVGPSNAAVAYILDDDLTPLPEVTIVATDPDASESGPDTGTFTVSRTGDTSTALGVFYTLGGTAQNVVDYLALSSNLVIIPAGAASADIIVTPIDDALVEGIETVQVQLRLPVWPEDFRGVAAPAPPFNFGWPPYVVGVPGDALVTIADNDGTETNHPPFVHLNTPLEGDVFAAPADIPLRAYAQDIEDGYNLEVEFFVGTNSLGFGTFVPTRCAAPFCPFFALTWSNVPPGDYTLTARATDHQGATSVSEAVPIGVTGTNPPVVTIVARDPIAVEGPFCWSNWWWTSSWNTGGWIVTPGSGDPNSPAWRPNFCPGTNTGIFVVHRSGPTNSDLPVYYAISGTASNGVDYVTLSGSVTIPVGRRSAQIEVLPIEDNLPEGIETIVLTLQSSPDYTVGFPARAAAIIIDNDRPRPPCALLTDHSFHFCGPATNGFCFRIEASSDLQHWVPLCTNVVTDGALHFVDPDALPFNLRFYRAEPEPGLPPDE